MTPATYFYDVPLPNAFSATVQILKTGRAMAEAGRPFTFAARSSDTMPEAILSNIGLSPHPRLGIEGRYPLRPTLPQLRDPLLRLRPPRGLRASPIVLSRGESGFPLAPRLRPGQPFIYELHRLACIAEAERLLGRRLEPGEALPPAAERVRRVEGRTIARANGLVFLTAAVRAAAETLFPITVPHVLAPSGVDVPAAPPSGRKDIDLIYVGKIELRKGIDIALATLRHLPGRSLRLVGDGPGLPWAQTLARELGVSDRVEFAGRVPHAAVPAHLVRARVGLVPLPGNVDGVSERFTSPLKLLEVMAAGLPIVATNLPSVRAICADGETALLAPPDAPEAIAAAVERLLQDPELGSRLAAAGRRRARDFSWHRRAETINALLDAVG